MSNTTDFYILNWKYNKVTESMPWLDKETGLHAEQTHAEVFVTIDYKDAIHIVSFLHPFDEEDNEDTLKADIDKLLEKGYHNELFYEILESKPEEEVG